MLIKEARLRSIIRSIIKEGYKWKDESKAPYYFEPRKPESVVTPNPAETDYDAYDAFSYDYDENMGGQGYDDDSIGWSGWEQTHPGMEPEVGDEVISGNHTYSFDGDRWIKFKRY